MRCGSSRSRSRKQPEPANGTREWVQGVIDGAVDPTLDELELALNAIGLETRISLGLPDEPWPPAVPHDRERIADTIRRHRALDTEMYGQMWIRRTPPQPGATARLFGAGPGRQDGGGWAAILFDNVLHGLGVSHAEFAHRAGIPPSDAQQIASGDIKPQTGDFERMLAANGVPMAIRIDIYCEDDDDEHAMWEANPEGYEATIAAIRAEFQAAQPIPRRRRRTRRQKGLDERPPSPKLSDLRVPRRPVSPPHSVRSREPPKRIAGGRIRASGRARASGCRSGPRHD